jgi:hypothetical protein
VAVGQSSALDAVNRAGLRLSRQSGPALAMGQRVERKTGLEPATLTLAR